MPSILLSIKPIYAERIFDGLKKYEYRTRLCKESIDKIVIYETSPICKIVGEVEVLGKIVKPVNDLWEETKEYSGITKEGWYAYFTDSKQASAYILGKSRKYDNKYTLADYNIVKAPQNFVYLR